MPEPELVYLATPYSHPSATVRHVRFETACQLAAELIEAGYHVFSPISHNHSVAWHANRPLEAAYWAPFNQLIMNSCQRLIVLQQPGWRESLGVQAELAYAEENNIPISYMNMEGELRDEPGAT